MNPLSYSLSYWRFHALRSLLLMVSIAAGLILATLLWQARHDVENHWQRDLAGLDLVVGAKGSGLQLLLSAVLHVDVPTGNIDHQTFQELQNNPLVKQAIPVSLGDNYHTFRIVGTSPDFITHYNGQFAAGGLWHKELDIVLGSMVARDTGLKIGDHFAGTHGFAAEGEVHEQFPYTVTGILQPTGTVMDRLLLTGSDSVWYIHAHPDADDIARGEVVHGKEVTAALIAYRSPLSAASIPRMINATMRAQAVSPALAFNQLWQLIKPFSALLMLLAGALIVLGYAHMATALAQQTAHRHFEYGLLRALGATPARLGVYVLMDGLIMGLGSVVLATLIGQIVWFIARHSVGDMAYNLAGQTALLQTQLWVGAVGILVAIVMMIPLFLIIRHKAVTTLLQHD